MPTETFLTRNQPAARESLARGFTVALALHGLAALALIAAAYIAHHHSNPRWGDQNPMAGAIQASMVNALPLPPKQRPVDKEVLASEHPGVAPKVDPAPPEPKAKVTPPPPKAEAPPKPNEVLIPNKVTPPKNVRPSETTTPEAPKRPPATPPPPTTKAPTGDAPAVQIPMAVTQLRNGASAITVDDHAFGDRYAYYIALVSRKANQSKAEGEADPTEAKGKRTVIHFTITRDGTPTDIGVDTRSGSSALDTNTLRAIQRIDSFGPLPAGDHLVIRYVFDSR